MEILTSTNPEVMPQGVIDAGLSPFRCDRCGQHVTEEVVRFSRIWYEEPLLKCTTCEDGFQKGSVTVVPSSAFLLDVENVRKTSWFHATCVDDWFEKVSSGHGMEKETGDFLYIHVGSEEAARDIAEDKYFRNPRDGERISLYELRLVTDLALSPLILNDGETWWDYSSVTAETRAAVGGDAARYLNRWESPGSISLLIDARKLELVSVREIHSRGALDC
jgi:hypothetical protein